MFSSDLAANNMPLALKFFGSLPKALINSSTLMQNVIRLMDHPRVLRWTGLSLKAEHSDSKHCFRHQSNCQKNVHSIA